MSFLGRFSHWLRHYDPVVCSLCFLGCRVMVDIELPKAYGMREPWNILLGTRFSLRSMKRGPVTARWTSQTGPSRPRPDPLPRPTPIDYHVICGNDDVIRRPTPAEAAASCAAACREWTAQDVAEACEWPRDFTR